MIEAVRGDHNYYHINDGFFYTVNNSTQTDVYLKCKDWRRLHCPGRAIMPLIPEHRYIDRFVISAAHTHPPDHMLGNVLNLRKRILERCESENVQNQIQIFHEECRR